METLTGSAADSTPRAWLRSLIWYYPDLQLVASVMDVDRRLSALEEASRFKAAYGFVADDIDFLESAEMERVMKLLEESGCTWALSDKFLNLPDPLQLNLLLDHPGAIHLLEVTVQQKAECVAALAREYREATSAGQ